MNSPAFSFPGSAIFPDYDICPFFYYLISCTLLQYYNKFTVMQIKLVVVVVVVVGLSGVDTETMKAFFLKAKRFC